MRSFSLFTSAIAAFAGLARADLKLAEPLQSKQLLPSTFAPPQVFKNAHLVRTTNLDKAYPRETVNVLIENIASQPQSEYYVPFDTSLLARVGGFEVRDKKNAAAGTFKVDVVGQRHVLGVDRQDPATTGDIGRPDVDEFVEPAWPQHRIGGDHDLGLHGCTFTGQRLDGGPVHRVRPEEGRGGDTAGSDEPGNLGQHLLAASVPGWAKKPTSFSWSGWFCWMPPIAKVSIG